MSFVNKDLNNRERKYYPLEDKAKFDEALVKAETEEKDRKAREEVERKPVPFKCASCGLNEICHYFGKRPPFARGQIEYVEDSFVMMDPFCPREKGRPNFLTIGGKCHECQNEVCVECSIFYGHRFCRDCALLNFDQFPNEVQARLKKFQ